LARGTAACTRHSTWHPARSTAPGTQHHALCTLSMIWIAVDAMGGDFAAAPLVDGALAAARHFDLGVVLVGARSALDADLRRHRAVASPRLRLVDADEVVHMEESPAAALRRKPRASVRVAADVVARGEASALFSAGHTGATVMAAHAAFGMLSGVD